MSMILTTREKPASKAEQNARDKQLAILRVAEAMFLKSGYAATRMDAVADKAGVTKQTVYRYFPAKEALFAAVMAQVRDNGAEPYTLGDGELAEELRQFGHWCLGFHINPRALGLYRLMLMEGGQRSLHQTFMEAGPQKVVGPLAEFLQQRCEGLEDPQFHARMFTSMLLAPRNTLLLGNDKKMNPEAQREHVEKVVGLFLKALRP